jgi:hypothetical protein
MAEGTDETTALPAAETTTLLGGRYRLGGLIGRGGMARVYEAFDERLGRPVAVKILVAAAVADRKRFEDEIHTLARLDHPSLVRVLDAGTEADSEYLVMELVKGTNLAERTRRTDDPLGSAAVALIGAGVGAALAYVHLQGFVHRDVKPANILLNAEGHPKLADFGIARAVGTSGATQTGLTIGTPAYLAPEQLTNSDEVGPPADVYALGLVLHECLTGHPVFEGSAAEVSAARLHRDPDISDTIPADWSILLRTMTARSPAARPTAAEVSAYLESLAGSEAKRLSASGAVSSAAAVVAAGAAAGLPLLPTLQLNNPILTRSGDPNGATEPLARPRRGGGARGRLMAGFVPVLLAGVFVGWVLSIPAPVKADPGAKSGARAGAPPTGSTTVPTVAGTHRPTVSGAAAGLVLTIARGEHERLVSPTAAGRLLAGIDPIALTRIAEHRRDRTLYRMLLGDYYVAVSDGGIKPAAMAPIASGIIELGKALRLPTSSISAMSTTTTTTPTTTVPGPQPAPPGGHGHGHGGDHGKGHD